jgi:hypothetical protein
MIGSWRIAMMMMIMMMATLLEAQAALLAEMEGVGPD